MKLIVRTQHGIRLRWEHVAFWRDDAPRRPGLVLAGLAGGGLCPVAEGLTEAEAGTLLRALDDVEQLAHGGVFDVPSFLEEVRTGDAFLAADAVTAGGRA